MKYLKTLDLSIICEEVESLVSKGMDFVAYPKRKALWETIKGSKVLHDLISGAKRKFVQLYHSSGKGADKSCRFYRAWLEYMASYTSDSESADKEYWMNLNDKAEQIFF